jgi:iron complex outermembrane receptor protein
MALQRGGGSSTFGSGAIGGSLIMDNSTIRKDSLLSLYHGVGSFGRQESGWALQWQRGDLISESRVYYGYLENDFPYALDGETFHQEHAAVERWGFSQRFNVQAGQHQLFSEAAYATNDRQIQPSFFSSSRDRLHTKNLRLVLGDNWSVGRAKHHLSMGFTLDETVFNKNDKTAARQWVGNYHYRFLVSTRIDARVGLMALSGRAESENFSGQPTREEFHLFTSWNWQPTDRWWLSLNLREVIFDNAAVFVPSLGSEWQPFARNEHWTLRSQISRGYRVPTFNDLYWVPGGNPDLLPETSLHMEGGLDFRTAPWEVSITGFGSRVTDWIQWMPREGVWQPFNIREVNVVGWEANVQHQWSPGARWNMESQLEYSFTRSRDVSEPSEHQLPYVPRHSLYGSIRLQHKRSSLTLNGNYTSERFANLSNTPQSRVDGFALLDISLAQDFLFAGIAVNGRFTARNIMDTDYQNILNLAMPGRNYFIEFNLKY